jgi:hypothetical protein
VDTVADGTGQHTPLLALRMRFSIHRILSS